MASIPPPPRIPDTRDMPAQVADWIKAQYAWLDLVAKALGAGDGDLGDAETRLDALEDNAVRGPATSVANAIARFDDTTGRILGSGRALLDDDGNLAALAFYVGEEKVVGARGAAITDALTGGSATAANCATTINLVLAQMRLDGKIAT